MKHGKKKGKAKSSGKSKGKSGGAASASSSQPNEWQTLRGANNLAPTRVADVATLLSTAPAAAQMPDQVALVAMVNSAGGLKYGVDNKGKYGEIISGIQFHIAEFVIQGNGDSSKQTLFNDFVSHKADSSFCYENSFLPIARVGDGNILIHQSLAPCENCCSGYAAWAARDSITIVVSFDKGYDGSGDDGWYIFSPVGNAYAI